MVTVGPLADYGVPGAGAERFSGDGLCDCVRIDVASALVWETAAHRERIHRAHWGSAMLCDAVLTVAGQPILRHGSSQAPHVAGGGAARVCPECGGQPTTARGPRRDGGPEFVLTGDCPCCGLLTDVLLSGHAFLVERGGTVRNPPAAARRHVRNRQHDHTRACRGERGAQVRTDRIRNTVRARGLATEEQRWLLHDVVDEAGSQAPLEGQHQLECRLAARRARRTGGDADAQLDAVRKDLRVVAAHCSTGPRVNVGTGDHPEYVSWWEAYVDRPLGKRRRLSDVPVVTVPLYDSEDRPRGLDVASSAGNDAFAFVLDRMVVDSVQPDVDPDDRVVLAALLASASRHPTVARDILLEKTLRELVAADLAAPGAVEAFLADPRRLAEAVVAFDALLVGDTHRTRG